MFSFFFHRYYEGGVSSVYAWDLDDGFAAVILIKKTQDSTKKGQPMKGTWDSIHVVEVMDQGSNAHYKLTSTVMLGIETETDQSGRVNLGGSMTRQVIFFFFLFLFLFFRPLFLIFLLHRPSKGAPSMTKTPMSPTSGAWSRIWR